MDWKVLCNVCRNNDCQYFLKTSESLKKKNYLGGRWQAKVEQQLVRKSMKYSQRTVRGLWQTKMDVNSLLLSHLSLLVFMASFSFASRKCHHNALKRGSNISFLELNHTLHIFIYLSHFLLSYLFSPISQGLSCKWYYSSIYEIQENIRINLLFYILHILL